MNCGDISWIECGKWKELFASDRWCKHFSKYCSILWTHICTKMATCRSQGSEFYDGNRCQPKKSERHRLDLIISIDEHPAFLLQKLSIAVETYIGDRADTDSSCIPVQVFLKQASLLLEMDSQKDIHDPIFCLLIKYFRFLYFRLVVLPRNSIFWEFGPIDCRTGLLLILLTLSPSLREGNSQSIWPASAFVK